MEQDSNELRNLYFCGKIYKKQIVWRHFWMLTVNDAVKRLSYYVKFTIEWQVCIESVATVIKVCIVLLLRQVAIGNKGMVTVLDNVNAVNDWRYGRRDVLVTDAIMRSLENTIIPHSIEKQRRQCNEIRFEQIGYQLRSHSVKGQSN